MTVGRGRNVGSYWMALRKGMDSGIEEALDRTLWRTHFERQTTEWNE
jgi:hypothetical protein